MKKDISFIVACSILITGISICLYFLLCDEKVELRFEENINNYLDYSFKEVEEKKEEIYTNEIISNNTNQNKIPETTIKTIETNNINENIISNEEEIIVFFNTLNNDLNSNDNSETLTRKIKTNFVIGVDFLFYDGEINGYTFSQLSNEAKLKVLEAMMFIDDKIDNVLPGYKETISATTGKIYNTVKEKVVEVYINVTDSICSNNADLCENAKKGLENMQYAFGLTWNFIKDIASRGTNRLSNWYLDWKDR